MTTPDPGMAVPAPSPLLAGFEHGRMDVDGVTVNHALGGSGSPLLLLHGYPENHLMWRHVAPVLAEDHTVVLPTCAATGILASPLRTPQAWFMPSAPWPATRPGSCASSALTS